MADNNQTSRQFVSLGMFIVDEFEYLDINGKPTDRTQESQIGGGGTYAAIGARIWLPSSDVGMIVDKGHDFPSHFRRSLQHYGLRMWHFRENPNHQTTRAVNRYVGDQRGFDYLTPRIRLTPADLVDTPLARPWVLHFICSPQRAHTIVSEVKSIPEWNPITVYEPIPYRCTPEELPALRAIAPDISILSPNHEEAFGLLSLPISESPVAIEQAAATLLDLGIGSAGTGAVILRCGSQGAYVTTRARGGQWLPAFWTLEDGDKVVDVTGAGNAFLGGLGAGLKLSEGDIYKAAAYATISAAYTIEQAGLPNLTTTTTNNADHTQEQWNGVSPLQRYQDYLARL